MPFLTALFTHTFLQHALLAGVLASLGCGVIGTYVVVKRIGYLAGGIAHAALGGMGAACYFAWPPMAGALLAALISAILVGGVNLWWREREDTLISALWSVGMAVGILFLSRTPGYNADLLSYLFGNILMAPAEGLWLMAGLDAVIVGVALVFAKQLEAIAFDEEFARLRGVRVEVFSFLLLLLVALTVVLLIQVAGLILVIALLTIPAAIAGHAVSTLPRMMAVASAFGILFTGGGLALSYGPDLPTGATIILLAGSAYLVVAGGLAAWKGWRRRVEVQ